MSFLGAQLVSSGESFEDSSETPSPVNFVTFSNKRKPRSRHIAGFKKKRLDGKLHLIFQERSGTDVRKPMCTMAVASLHVLTGAGFANCTTNTADSDTFVGDMTSKLHVTSANASEAQPAVSTSVRIVAELCFATKVKIFFKVLVSESCNAQSIESDKGNRRRNVCPLRELESTVSQPLLRGQLKKAMERSKIRTSVHYPYSG